MLLIGALALPGSRLVTFVSMRRTEELKASPRMFESNLLDRLSRVHPMVPVLIFVPAIAVLFVLGARTEPTRVGARACRSPATSSGR